MINFLDIKGFKKGLKPITATELFSKPGEFHPDGLFSEPIFGPEESTERKKTFAYIDLNASVIHPSAYMLLIQLDRKIELFVSAQETFSVDSKGTLQKDPDGVTGISSFIKLLPKIKFRGGTDTRDKFVKKIKESYKSGILFIDLIPVIPPTQRDAYQDEKGMWVIDPLNDYYIAMLRRAYQIKSAAKTGALFDLLNFELQKAVINHDNFIRKLIQKKRGLIRSQMLGKRTDFSGRAVVTPGPDLKINEIGIPLRMAVSLFEPFLIHRLFNSGRVDPVKLGKEVKKFIGLELSIDSMKSVLKAIKSGDDVPKALYDIIFEATEVAMMNRVVLAKRDPVLHAESVRSFNPILITGNTIQLCTLQVGGFNADFDGDTMAIFHPITNEAQEEVRTRMMRSESGENDTSVTFELSKEMCVGLFTLTKDVRKTTPPIAVTNKDLETAVDPYIPVVYRKKTTTMGKAIFNSVFPPTFPFYEEVVTKKVVNGMIPTILKKYGQEQAIKTFSALEKIGFKFSTIIAPSITLDDLKLPSEILQLKKQLEGASTEEASILLKKMQELLVKHLKDTGLHDLVESGSTKGWGQPMQLLVAKGLVADPTGKVLDPIKGSFSDGLTNKEYFAAAGGARKGIIDRTLNTADTGYMSRKLAYILNSVEIDRQLKDCKTKRTLDIRLTKELVTRINGRYLLEGGKPQLFNPKDYKIGTLIHLRSPIFCKGKKLCHTCYGKLLERHKSPYAGVMAAQMIGEAGTQDIMRSFHLGGAVKVIERDILSDIVQNDALVNQSTVKKLLSQIENTLSCNQDCIITVTKSDYPLPGDLAFNDDKTILKAKGVVSKIEFPDVIFNIILDYSIEFQLYKYEQIGKEIIKLEYKKNSTILEVPLQTEQTKEQIQYVTRLLGGREIYKDANHLFLKLFKVYGALRDMDIVHMEVLLSQALRDKKNPSIPARLGSRWDPTMINIKQIVFKTSFIQGLAFENINEAIKTGLITEEVGDPSILEKVLTGTLVEGKKR
jgi:DNA-directed RNA polymerase beta' subunit